MIFRRFLPFKTPIISAALLALALSGCLQSPEVKSARFIDTGKKLLKKNDPARAILEFRNAVRSTPNNAEAYYQLGLACLATGDRQGAFDALKKALDLNRKHAGAEFQMAQLKASTTDPTMLKEAQATLQELLQTSPGNAGVLGTLGIAELKLDKPEDAMKHLGRALDAAPRELALAMTLARVKLIQKDVKGAEEVLRKARESNPKSADALLILGSFYSSQSRLAEAQQQFQGALALNPNHEVSLLNLAIVQHRLGRQQDAENNFKRLAGLPGKNFKEAYAIFLFQQERRDEALREFQRLAKEDPKDRTARTHLVTAYTLMQRNADAEQVLNEALRKNKKDEDALIQRSGLYLRTGRTDLAEADLLQALRFRKDSEEAHFYLGLVYGRRGETLHAREQFSEAIRLNRGLLDARIALSQLLLSTGALKNALEVMDETPDDQLRTMPVIVQQNWALIANQAWDRLRKGVDSGLKLDKNRDLLFQNAIVKIGDKKLPEARVSLNEALQLNPEDLQSLDLLARTYSPDQRVALNVIREHALKNPKSPLIQYFWAEMLRANGDAKQARRVLAGITVESPKFVPAILMSAGMDALDGQYKEARAKLQPLVDSNTGGNQARMMLADVQSAAGDWQAAAEGYKLLIAAQPQNVNALNNLAFLLCERANKPDEALPYAQKAVEAAPDDGASKDTLGWILYRKGLYKSAVSQLESSVKKEPVAIRQYHLAMAYFRAGNRQEGQETLRLALRANPSLPEAHLAQQVFKDAQGPAPKR